jgi:FixJ family two-component response regulator
MRYFFIFFPSYLLVGIIIVCFTRARTQFLKDIEETKNARDKSGRQTPFYKLLLFVVIIFSVAVLLWPFSLSSWFGKKPVAFGLMKDDFVKRGNVLPVKVIHVNDEDWLLEMIGQTIHSKFQNVTIQTFQDGNQAWEVLSTADPDLLITDDKMPGLTGEDLVQRLVEKKVQYPIIVTSGWPLTEQWVQKYADTKFNITFLHCPFTTAQLYKTLSQQLGSKLQYQNGTSEKQLSEKPQKRRTMLDNVQEAGSKVIVSGYRRIGAQLGCAPTAKTADEKIIEIYTKVGTAFHEAAEQRGEHIPALYLNNIVLGFLKLYEMAGDQFVQQHLQYEVDKYLAEGLRQDYKQELSLIDLHV